MSLFKPEDVAKSLLPNVPLSHMVFRNHETEDFHHPDMIYIASPSTGLARQFIPIDRAAVAQCVSLWAYMPLDEFFQGTTRTVIDMLRAGW